MYPSIPSAFSSFHSKLIPTQAEKDAASSHRQSIVAKLEESFGVDYTYEIGSLNNGTGIHSHADLDLMVSIPSYNQRDSSTTMLSAVRDALIERFPFSDIGVRTPAVRCEFGPNDEEVVEVVPGYYQEQKDGSNIYKIPDFGGSWQTSAPRAHTIYVNGRNTALDSKLKPLIRFIKAIKYYNNIPVSSFYLEMRIAKWSESQQFIDYAWDVKAVLSHLYTIELAALQDPVGIAGYIYGYSGDYNKQDAISKLKSALGRATKAYEAGQQGDLANAHYWWNMLFDRKFS